MICFAIAKEVYVRNSIQMSGGRCADQCIVSWITGVRAEDPAFTSSVTIGLTEAALLQELLPNHSDSLLVLIDNALKNKYYWYTNINK